MEGPTVVEDWEAKLAHTDDDAAHVSDSVGSCGFGESSQIWNKDCYILIQEWSLNQISREMIFAVVNMHVHFDIIQLQYFICLLLSFLFSLFLFFLSPKGLLIKSHFFEFVVESFLFDLNPVCLIAEHAQEKDEDKVDGCYKAWENDNLGPIFHWERQTD